MTHRTQHLAPFGALAAALLWLWQGPAAMAQSTLYSRYAGQPGVRVAEVEGFRIDSATAINVLIIEADGNEGWQWMQRQFAIGDPAPEQQRDLLAGNDVVLFAQRHRDDPGLPAPVVDEHVDASRSCYLGISYLGRSIFIFSPQTAQQTDAIVSLLLRKMLHTGR